MPQNLYLGRKKKHLEKSNVKITGWVGIDAEKYVYNNNNNNKKNTLPWAKKESKRVFRCILFKKVSEH